MHEAVADLCHLDMDRREAIRRQVEVMAERGLRVLGVSGVSGDMRAVEASGTLQAQEAMELYVYRIGQQLGGAAAALGGLDALVFTAGIGENSALIRRHVCRAASWLGIEHDEDAHQAAHQHGGQPCGGVGDSGQ